MTPQRWSVGLFTLPQNFKTILDEAAAKNETIQDKKGEEEGIKVICVGLSRWINQSLHDQGWIILDNIVKGTSFEDLCSGKRALTNLTITSNFK